MRRVWERSVRCGRLAVVAMAVVALAAGVGGCRQAQGAAGGAGAASVPSVPVGSSAHSIVVDGRTRTYLVYRPAVLPAAAPLVVMLHGGFGTASQAEKSYHWDAEADAGHFVVAYPNGLGRAWNAGGGCCGSPARDGTATVSTRATVTTSVARCPGGRAVELITIAGAGHQWPGGASNPVVQKLLQLDPPSTALDATAAIWRFFAAHAS